MIATIGGEALRFFESSSSVILNEKRFVGVRRSDIQQSTGDEVALTRSVMLLFNLMIDVTLVFTAKIADLMWLLVGYARHQTAPRRMSSPVSTKAALPWESLS